MNKQILNKGIQLAKNLNPDKYRLVALITDKRGNIISTGHNSYEKSHPKQAHYAKKVGNIHKIFLHAEIAALLGCKKIPYAIYIIRINKQGTHF